MNKKRRYLIFLLIFFSGILLYFPNTASAGIPGISDVVSWSSHALEGVEEAAKGYFDQINSLLWSYLKTLILLLVSSHLLDSAMKATIDLHGSLLVMTGWGYMMKLANLFFVLAIIIIAFAHIFQLETFKIKQTLPRLIIAILLVNFSLLFIGMLIDISTFLQKTILPPEKNLAFETVKAFSGEIKGGISKIALWISKKALLSMPPVIGPAAQKIVTVSAIPFIIPWVASIHVQIWLASLISAIFFLYFLLFTLRVYVIQILAIFAPLAFAVWVLPFPQTQKLWQTWLKYLIEWVFLGIVALFLLVLGLKLGEILMPGWGPDFIPIYGWFNLSKYTTYYLFLVIYLSTAFAISIKLVPAGAEKLIDIAAKVVAPTTLARGLTSLWGGVKTSTREAIPESWMRRAEMAAMAPPPKGALAQASWAVSRTLGRAISPEAEVADTEKIKGDLEKKIKTPESLLSYMRESGRTRAQRIAAAQLMTDKKWTKKLTDLGLSEEEIIKTGKEALSLSPEAFKPIRTAYPHLAEKMGKGLSVEARKKGGLILTDEDIKKYGPIGTITKKLVAEASSKDIEMWSPSVLKNPVAKEAFHLMRGNQYAAAAKTFGRDFVDPLMEEADIKGEGWYERYNPSGAKYFRSTIGQALGLHPPRPGGPYAPPPVSASVSENLKRRVEGIKTKEIELEEANKRFYKTGEPSGFSSTENRKEREALEKERKGLEKDITHIEEELKKIPTPPEIEKPPKEEVRARPGVSKQEGPPRTRK